MMEFKAADKYRRMLRAYEEIDRISTNTGNTVSNADARDAVEDFFNQAQSSRTTATAPIF